MNTLRPNVARRTCASVVIAAWLTSACSAPGERAVKDSATAPVDTAAAAAPRRIASDATLLLYDAPDLAGAFRSLADSFAMREAVNVVDDSASNEEIARRVVARPPDLVALTDVRVFDRALIPAHVSWYITFAHDRVVIAYRDSSRGAATIDTAAWWKTLQRRAVRVGRANPVTDPKGVRPLVVMQLAEQHYRQPRLANRLRALTPPKNLRDREADVVSALQAGDLDYAWTHESAAQAAGLRYLRLPDEIDLGTPADSDTYATAEVVIAGATPGDTIRVRGAPIVYGVAIPNAAPNPRYADRFLRFLLSDDGQRILGTAHLDVLRNPTVHGTAVPAEIAALVGTPPAADSVTRP